MMLVANAGTAVIGAVSTVPGDYFTNPISLTGLSGALGVDLLNSTVELTEPDYATFNHSIWLEFSPTMGGTFTVTSGEMSSFNHTIEIFDGATLATLNLLASGVWIDGTSTEAASASTAVGTGGPYYVRVRDYGTGTDASLSLTWSLTTRSPVLIQEIQTTSITESPGSVLVSVVNGDPNETLNFTLVGTGVVYSAPADSSGTLINTSVPIPASPAGTYTLRVEGASSGRYDEDSFQILNPPLEYPTPPASDAPPVDVPQVGVRKWVLQDPVSGGLAEYTFPFNPSTMAPIFAPRIVDVEHTTSPVGTAVVWEGAARAHQWEFSGYLETQAFFDALVAYFNVNHRFYLIDHRNRAWVVTFDQLDLQPRRNIEKPYAHDYTIQALIFGEATQL